MKDNEKQMKVKIESLILTMMFFENFMLYGNGNGNGNIPASSS